MTEDPVFQLSDRQANGEAGDLLGLWAPEPAAGVAGAVAFGAPGEAAADAPVWRANLPADPLAAGAALDGAEARLAQNQEVLDQAERRMAALASRPAGPVAFGTSFAAEPLPQAEKELLGLLQEARYGRQPVSFGLGEDLSEGWGEAVEEFQAFAARVEQVITHFAWVETEVEGRLIGRTSVNWIGDLETAWEHDLGDGQLALHRRTLAMALASRQLLVRSMIVVAAGAGQLSALLAAPGGAILALPAAWKFINQIRAELDRFNAKVAQTDSAGD